LAVGRALRITLEMKNTLRTKIFDLAVLTLAWLFALLTYILAVGQSAVLSELLR
jgi:hypothetical protein